MGDEGQKKQALITAIRLLAATPKTRRALTQKLLQKGYPEPVVEETLDHLERQHVLDDKAYALNLLNRFRFFQPSGRQKMIFEMKRRGIPAKIQEEVLSQVHREEEIETARQVGRERWERFANTPAPKRKKRVYDFLIRRGFDFQVCRDLVEELSAAKDSRDE